MPLGAVLVAGILLWVLAPGAWATVGVVLTIISGGLLAFFLLLALIAGAAVWRRWP